MESIGIDEVEALESPISVETVNEENAEVRRPHTVIKIVSATYGPAKDRRLLTGESSSNDKASAPYTRDVAPFLKALLAARQQRELEEEQSETDEGSAGGEDDHNLVRMINTDPKTGNFIALMDGQSMNAIFGDPCPGNSKRLMVHYVVSESSEEATSRAATSEVHRVEFAEHERVILRRRVTFYQDESTLKNAVVAAARKSNHDSSRHDVSGEDEDESVLRAARRMGRAQSITELAEATAGKTEVASWTQHHLDMIDEEGRSQKLVQTSPCVSPKSVRKYRLRSATSEIVLPIILQFLDVRERVNCQLVCKVWAIVVRHSGVAQTVDVNDSSFPNFTRAFLRGLMSQSYSSLQYLYLVDFHELTKDDLHPAIPHLRKLRSLDISRCYQLDDSTLQLIAQHLQSSLEVFYMKGLRKVTDEGLISICHACKKLRVLEISNVKITDDSGIAIGENLTELQALYMRDNYLLTNRSIDIITEKCTRLNQLTLWGCTRLRHLSFERMNHSSPAGCEIILLNLWGCHSLLDEAADALRPMRSLRSLIVSECHQLTDAFFLRLAHESGPRLIHLHCRYCKRITDASINAITNSMQKIYSLDLSFCTRITAASISNLLEIRIGTLSELRLQSCVQLDIAVNPQSQTNQGLDGMSILNAIQSLGDSCLCIIDLRNCGGQPSPNENYLESDPFVQGMLSLQFEQIVPGFFSRKARWNPSIQGRLMDELLPARSSQQGES